MKTINEMFVKVVNEGFNSIKGISDFDKKALACAEMAKALAMTGMVKTPDSKTEEDTIKIEERPEETKKEENVSEEKESLKSKPKTESKTKPKPKVKKQQDSAEKKESEKAPISEWNEETREMYKEELEYIESLEKEYGEESVNEVLQDYSKGNLEKSEQITPIDIQGFVAHLKELIASNEEEEEENEE